jgi:hypothetical protein
VTRPGRGEAGSGVFSSAMGLVFFLGFLFLTTSALVTLYRTSAVSTAARDAARAAADAAVPAANGRSGAAAGATGDGPGARVCDDVVTRAAVEHARRLLGSGVRAEATCVGAAAVSVTVEAPRPTLGALLGRGPIRRHAEARFEARVVPGTAA